MKIYFIGIGGIGVSALAQYYLEKGHDIYGFDLAGSEITDSLKRRGAKIEILNSKARVSRDINLVIYSPAVQKSNPILKQFRKLRAKNQKLRILSYPEALGKLTKEYFTIAVSGTHGKSTTASMLALVLVRAGLDPTVFIGTKIKEFNDTNFRMGKGKYLVIEADEHFASFLNYWPKMIVLTNIGKDHLDYYRNQNNILKAFKEYVGHLPKDGFFILNKDDKNSLKILSSAKSNVKEYDLKQSEAEKLKNILQIPGEHNIYNALSVLAAARCLKTPDDVIFKSLAEYKGAWRRFEIINAKKFTIVSDYAHNPVKAEAALKAAREKYPKKEIWCIYQPHQYQRTHYLFKDFVKVFKEVPVDKIIITDIFDVAGREEKGIAKKVNSEKLVKAIKKENASYLPKKELIDFLKNNIPSNVVLVIMGAGDIYKIIDELKA